MSRATAILLSFLLISLLVGCDEESPWQEPEDKDTNYYGFVTSEIVLDVTPETKSLSYRIEVEWTHEVHDDPFVVIDKKNTTAKHNVHFVNTPVGSSEIGEFSLPLEGKIVYKDVEVIPENITEKVVIIYYLWSWENEPEGLIKKLTVVLQPKTQE